MSHAEPFIPKILDQFVPFGGAVGDFPINFPNKQKTEFLDKKRKIKK
jgi:hypothetical protein